MIEQTCLSEEKVRILSHTNDINICPKGQDIRSGDIILNAPTTLGALEIANLISVGITEVKVSRPVRAAIIATGNEIVNTFENLQSGKIMNSNSPMLECLCRKYSLEINSSRIVPDNCDTTVSALCEALRTADIIIFSGGVSAGDYDYVADAINMAGLNLHFNRIAVKPGKPMTFASLDEKAVFGLPGNPVAVFLMFHIFVLYAARLMIGMKTPLRYIHLPIANDYHRRNAERMAFLPCKLTRDGLLEQVEYHGTAHLRALLDCDGFFVVPKDVTEIKSKEKVEFLSIKDSFV
jgi:molybdopterin molybdotransferase